MVFFLFFIMATHTGQWWNYCTC